MADHRDYLDEQYKLAALDYRTAHSEDERWSARKRMAQTERWLLSCTGLSLQTVCIRNMSILYWINDFSRIYYILPFHRTLYVLPPERHIGIKKPFPVGTFPIMS